MKDKNNQQLFFVVESKTTIYIMTNQKHAALKQAAVLRFLNTPCGVEIYRQTELEDYLSSGVNKKIQLEA